MNHRQSKCYSIIPAAGRSQRMGCQKLLMPWPERADGSSSHSMTVLDSVLSAWHNSQVDEIVVVLREPTVEDLEHKRLLQICSKYRVHLVLLEDPPDMKASVIGAIQFLKKTFQPMEHERCFVSPADLPTLSSAIINKMLEQEITVDQSCVPFFGDKKGHPVMMGWELLKAAFNLNENQGINAIVESSVTVPIHFAAEELVADIDTPEDYRRLSNREK